MGEILYCIRQYQDNHTEYFIGAASGNNTDNSIEFEGYYIGFKDNFSLYVKETSDEIYKGETIEDGFACAIGEEEYSSIANLIREDRIPEAYEAIESVWKEYEN